MEITLPPVVTNKIMFFPEVFIASPVIGLEFSYTTFDLLCLQKKNQQTHV